MTLAMRSPNAAHIDFGFLSGAIPGHPKAIPCDIDMIYERNNQFLVGEWKVLGERISLGQEITLKAMSNMNNFNVYIIQGYSNQSGVEVGKICKLVNGKIVDIGSGKDRLKSIITSWWDYASSIKR